MTRIGKLGDKIKVLRKLPNRESWHGSVCTLKSYAGTDRVNLEHGNKVCEFPESALRNVTQRPREEDTRPIGVRIAQDKNKPKRKVRRIR